MLKIFESVIKAVASVNSDEREPIDYSQNLEIAKAVEEERTKRNKENNETVKFITKFAGAIVLTYLLVLVALNYQFVTQ